MNYSNLKKDIEPALTLKNIKKEYLSHSGMKIELLHNLNLKVYPGECVAFIGNNGSGKTTLLKIIAGLEKPTTGSVIYGKGCEDVTLLAQGVAEYSGRHITLCEQINLGRITVKSDNNNRLNLSNTKAKEFAFNILARLQMGLEDRLDDYIEHLSGGQVQAVMLASLLGNNPPRLLLLDEHSSSLDQSAREVVIRLLKDSIETDRTSLLVVTHDNNIVSSLATKIVEVPPACFIQTGS